MANEPEPNNFWQEIEGINLSGLENDREDQYPTIPQSEISQAYEINPLRGDLLRLADSIMQNSKDRADGINPRKKEYHEMGWEICIDTPQGFVGLWSCWSGDQFYLGYPKRTKSVIESIDPDTILELGNSLKFHRLPPNSPSWMRQPLDFLGAKGELELMSDPELRTTLKAHRVNFVDTPMIPVHDELIISTLGVEFAKPVTQVTATAVDDWNYKGQFADPDKPLEQNSAGQIIGFSEKGDRLWARFYGPTEPTGGRVWIDHSGHHSDSADFRTINDKGELEKIYYGHWLSNGIFTYPLNGYSKHSPDGPTKKLDAIQKYKDKFINLAAEIAFLMGGPKSIHVNYGLSLVPEDIYREGYEDIRWLKGDLGERKGWENEMVRARKGDSIVILNSGNSLVPWSTTMRAPASKLTNSSQLSEFIKEDILWF